MGGVSVYIHWWRGSCRGSGYNVYIHLGRQAGPLILYAVNWIVVSMVLGGGVVEVVYMVGFEGTTGVIYISFPEHWWLGVCRKGSWLYVFHD